MVQRYCSGSDFPTFGTLKQDLQRQA
jgi:hypothetical protein